MADALAWTGAIGGVIAAAGAIAQGVTHVRRRRAPDEWLIHVRDPSPDPPVRIVIVELVSDRPVTRLHLAVMTTATTPGVVERGHVRPGDQIGPFKVSASWYPNSEIIITWHRPHAGRDVSYQVRRTLPSPSWPRTAESTAKDPVERTTPKQRRHQQHRP